MLAENCGSLKTFVVAACPAALRNVRQGFRWGDRAGQIFPQGCPSRVNGTQSQEWRVVYASSAQSVFAGGRSGSPPPGRGVLVERAVGRPPAILLPSGGGRRPVFFLGRLWGGLTLATEGATVAAAKIKRDGCDATLSVRASMKVGRLTGRGAGVWIAVVPRTAIF